MQYRIIPVTPFMQNCSLIWDPQTKDAALVDPGGDTERLVAAIKDAGVRLRKILLTHGHLDHVGGTAALVEAFQVPVEGPHPDDQFWLDDLKGQAQWMGFAPVNAFTPTRWLFDGDEVELGAYRLKVLHCPGHTPGHVVFFCPQTRLAWVGDVLFAGSIGRSDFPRGNGADLQRSIREKLWPLGDDVAFIPGHGPMSTLGHERLHNPFVAAPHYG